MNDLTLTAGGGYSRSRTHYRDINTGFFNNVIARITRIGLDGGARLHDSARLANDPDLGPLVVGPRAALVATILNANNIRSREFGGQNQIFMGYLEGKKTFNLGRVPLNVISGIKTRLTTHDVESDNSAQWTYVGPGGTLASQTSGGVPHPSSEQFRPEGAAGT